MKNGEKVIELKKEEIDKPIEELTQSLILYVVGESPTIAAMEGYITLQVNTMSKPKVYYHNDAYFLVRFANMDDRNKVLYSGPHFLDNQPIIVKVWSPEFHFNKEVLQTVPIWVKYPNLPLSCWSKDSLMLIEMNVDRELPRELKVEDPNGWVFEQVVQYKWVPEYCAKCMQVGLKCHGKEWVKVQRKVTKWQPKVDASKAGEVKVLEEQVAAPREETWKQTPSKAA
ncbi:hypothetical protein KY289_011365 [Solanum tuberosum]|nr:hypothetical protein KY289_011365 [Solanum tuberosum]